MVAKLSPSWEKTLAKSASSFEFLSLEITQAKEETKVTNSQGFIKPPITIYENKKQKWIINKFNIIVKYHL